MPTDSNSLLGHTLGTSTLEHLLGRGGMGAVFIARQVRPRRSVAVKVLLPGPDLNEQAQANFLARFRREADAIAALDHIHIMPIYEYGEQDHLAYLVMPHITGGTLRQILLKRGALPLNEALPIIEQVAEALDYAHERGIIHRDIKPGNILFHADGRLLLADFGLAKVLSEDTEAMVAVCPEPEAEEENKQHEHDPASLSKEAMIGTPEYLSPEQALGQPVDRRTDIYSLGIVLFQMLTGEMPFVGSSPVTTAIMHIQAELPSPSTIMPGITPEVEEVMLRAIAKKPFQRYNTAGEFARALRAAAHNEQEQPTHNLAPRKIFALAPQTLDDNDTIPEMELVLVEQTTIRSAEAQTQAPEILLPQRKPGRARNALLVTLCLLLILGGTFAYLARSFAPQHPVSTHTKSTPTLTSTASPTQPASSGLPLAVGTQLYASTLLYPSCNGDTTKKSVWSEDNGAKIRCRSNGTELTNGLPPSPPYLAGIYLNGINGQAIPNDYILHVEAIQQRGSRGRFGVYYRNQPNQNGHPHYGTYALLIDPTTGSWIVYVYNDTNSARTELAKGTASLSSLLAIDIEVQGNTFTLYLNNKPLGTVNSTYSPYPSYASGTIGFAVSTGTDILFRNLAIYHLPGT